MEAISHLRCDPEVHNGSHTRSVIAEVLTVITRGV